MAIICAIRAQSYYKNVEKSVFLQKKCTFLLFFLKKFGVFEKKIVSLQAE